MQPRAKKHKAAAAPPSGEPESEPTPEPGSLIVVRVDAASTADLEVHCKIGGGAGRRQVCAVDATQVQDAWADEAPLGRLAQGRFVRARVLHASPFARNKLLALSTRESLVSGAVSVDDELAAAEQVPRVGDLVTGYVHQANAKGCFVRLSRLLTARVELRNLADGFVSDVGGEFPPGKLVAGRVIAVAERRVDLSLKRSAVMGESEKAWALQVGAACDGVVKSVTAHGIFVRLAAAGVDALCRERVPGLGPGDLVKCLVSAVDAKGRVSVSLKPSALLDAAAAASVVEDRAVAAAGRKAAATATATPTTNDDDDEPARPAMTLEDALAAANVAVPATSAARADASDDDDDASGVAAAGAASKRHNKLNPQRREAQRERAFLEARALEDRLAADAPPETAADVERLLVAAPHSSALYIRLMAMHLAVTEVDAARAAGERALKHISYREEDEKRNVWRALLQLETDFGTEASLRALFARMLRENDAKWAHLALADALAGRAASDEAAPETLASRRAAVDEALRAARKATKGRSLKVWMRAVELKFDWDEAAQARAVFKEAMRAVPARKHVKALLRLARLEFTHARGDAEKGRTLMEGVVSGFPKRTDAWHVYIDLEIKHGSAEHARALFARAVNAKMPVKRAKTFFKKWLEFETAHGDEAAREHVKALARQFVEAL